MVPFYWFYRSSILFCRKRSEWSYFIKEELRWSINHKDLIKKSNDMFIFQEMENVLETDSKIYGMTINGTSDELKI